MTSGKWDTRIERARALEKIHPSASEGLRFYERVAQAQKSISADLESQFEKVKKQRAPGGLRQEFDLFFLLPRLAPFLSIVEQHAPSPLALLVHAMRLRNGNHAREMLVRFWEAGSVAAADLEPAEALVSWAFLQPYAEFLAGTMDVSSSGETPSLCPLCSGKPLVGVLRQEGDGGKRSLICALCAHEWNYRRILCPDCGAEDPHKLAVYSAEGIAHVRVEACDVCRHYIKTVDLTKDGRAVPVVDDLATIPLDLWAREHGYEKLQVNLLGM